MKSMKKLNSIRTIALASLVGIAATSTCQAIAYTAVGNGPVTAYFYGSDAGYNSVIGLRVNGVSTGITGLPNHATAPGTSLLLGNVSAGDTIEFYLNVLSAGYTLYSNPANNAGGIEYTVSAPFAGGPFGIPAGTYVGWEDIQGTPNGQGDYNDHQFVFTGPGLSSVPEGGSSMVLMGTAILSLGLIGRFMKK